MIEYIFSGFIGMSNGDLGDGLQKTTLVDVMQRRTGNIKYHLTPEKAEVSPGIWVRGPNTGTWVSDPNTTSRDQIMSMVVWTGYAKRKDLLDRQLKEQIIRFGFYQNKFEIWSGDNPIEKPWYKVDFASPEHWMQYVRSYAMISGSAWYNVFRPLLVITDSFMLLNSVITVVRSYFDKEHSDDDNAVLGMIQAYDVLDTPTAWLARKIYRLRATAGTTKGVFSAIHHKHRKETGAPPIGDWFPGSTPF